jgi:hypothetical protein
MTRESDRDDGPNNEPIVDQQKLYEALRKIIDQKPEGQDQKAFLVAGVRARCESLAPEHAQILAQSVMKDLETVDTADIENLCQQAAQTINQYLTSHFTKSEFEKLSRERFVREGGFEPLSEVISFHHSDAIAHIHLAPAETMGLNLLAQIRLGLRELAKRLENDQKLNDIQNIVATSWIVAAHPEILTRFGFNVLGQISEEEKAAHFSYETRPIARAIMTREAYLEKWSQANPNGE